ncbi:hypothetical protein ISCGN_003448 [Ixodes scapularis]
MKSNSFELGSKGTPQGAVLSPLLFSLALRGLPEALGAVPGVEHAIYADDITLWCREGNDAEIEERLQAAAKIVEDYAEECGLKCAPEKSELLVLRNPYERVSEQIEVWVSGKRVSKPTEICILGQLIRQGRGNKSTIDKLDTMTTQLKRLASTKNGAWLMDKLGMAVPGGTHTDTVPDHELSAEIRKKIVTNTGCPGQQEETLQHACGTVARYAISIGLACSPSKSELLVISNRKNNPDRQLITVHLDEQAQLPIVMIQKCDILSIRFGVRKLM